MNRFWIPIGAFALLVVVFAVALKRAPEKQFVQSALIGKPAPEFVLPDLLAPGASVDSKSFKGRWVLVNVWGTWCVECRVEHPVLLDIKREGKVAIVGLNYKDEDAAALKWLTDLGNPYDAVAVDREGRAAIDFGVYGAPESFLVDPAGVIVHKVVGVVTAPMWRDTLLPLMNGARR
ncbi:MAG: DsbE family thiol:disulfide interchange protein [Steroidobacteraceae bacterium]